MSRPRMLTAQERAQLDGLAFDLEEMRRFVARNWPNCVDTIMVAVDKLWTRVGITYDQATGTFYGRGPGRAHANTSISLDQDFWALRAAAKEWLPPRPSGNSSRYDRKRGWTIDDPIGRLIKFQLHKFEQLGQPQARRAPQAFERDAAPAPGIAENDVADDPHTPIKHSGSGKRPRAEASSSQAIGHREAELVHQLSVANAEPHALDQLSLGETRRLKRQLQSALHRCQQHEEKLEEAQNECVVCCSAPKTIAFGPCGHLASCDTCSWHPEMKRCPICQGPIKQRMRIFGT